MSPTPFLAWSDTLGPAAAVSVAASAQGGPPFRTDDPDTPGNKHWEINFGWIGDRNPAAGAYQVPDFDFNYGLGDRYPVEVRDSDRDRGDSRTTCHAHLTCSYGQVIGFGRQSARNQWRYL